MHSNLLSTLPRSLKLPAAALALLFAGGFEGCSKKSSSISIVSTEPGANAVNVDPGAAVKIAFSAPVKESSLSPASFAVQGSVSGQVAGQITYDDPSRTATFHPAAPFKDGETVTVTLQSSIQGKSGAGIRGQSFSFSIKPGAVAPPPPPPPPTPPAAAVSSRHPAPFATGVAADATVNVEFSQRMNPLTFSSATVRLEGDQGGRIDTQIGDLAIVGTRVAILPRRRFLPGEWITVCLGSGLKTAAGGSFPGDQFGFRAGALPPAGKRLPGPTLSTGVAIGAFELADLDLDGRLDLIYAASGDSKLKLARSAGNGRFDPAGTLDAGRPVLALHATDLDDDGHMDILVGAIDRVVIFRGKGPGISLGQPEVFPTGTAVRDFVVGDLDRNGAPDVVLDTDRGLRLYQNGLAGAPSLLIGDERLPRTPLLLRDLDLNGLPDLLYGAAAGSRLAIYAGVAGNAGLSSSAQPLAVGGDPLWVQVEDLDRDGRPEILTISASAGGPELEILSPPAASGGSAGAAPLVEPLPQAANRSYTLADVNGDGFTDLVAADSEAAKVIFFLNKNGSFDLSAPETAAENVNAQRVVCADITGDGVLDLVVQAGGEFRTLLSEGGSDPTPPPPPPVTPSVQLKVDSLQAAAGDTGKKAVVRVSTNVPLQAYTVVLAFDPLAVTVTGLDLDGTAAAALQPEFVSPSLHAADGYAALGVAFDLLPPFDERTLAAGNDLSILNFKFDVPASAPAGSHALDFKDGLGNPPLSNGVVNDGKTVAPQMTGGAITVTAPTPPNPNRLSIRPVQVAAGATGASALVSLTSAQPIDAYSVVGNFDPAATLVTGFDIAGTVTQTMAPEFVVPMVRAAEGFFAYSVIFDFSPPFDHQQILPGQDQPLVKVLFNVPADAPLGDHKLDLRNDLGDPPLSNSLVAEGMSVYPDLGDGVITVVAKPPPPPAAKFIRGDVNGSGRVDISDFTYLLNYLFQKGPVPPCLEAADVDDNGTVNFTDSVGLIDYIFKGKAMPRPPFPTADVDPTPDALGCLQSS